MAPWLYETASASPDGLVGYGVLDALGMRIGAVEGWVRAPDGTLALVVLSQKSLLRLSRHLVPLGYVVQVDGHKRYLHLRELTRRSLPLHCPRIGEAGLPSDDDLERAVREAPHVRPEVASLLSRPATGIRAMRPGRLSLSAEQGDGSSSGPPDLPVWRRADRIAEPRLPAWAPLTPAHDAGDWHPLADLGGSDFRR